MLTEANGTPLSAILTGANRHDVTQLLPLLDMELGWTPCRRCGVHTAVPVIDPSDCTPTGPMTRGGIGLGVYRWVVERTLGWLHQFRRLRVRYERRADIHEAFLSLGCSIICFRRLTSFC